MYTRVLKVLPRLLSGWLGGTRTAEHPSSSTASSSAKCLTTDKFVLDGDRWMTTPKEPPWRQKCSELSLSKMKDTVDPQRFCSVFLERVRN